MRNRIIDYLDLVCNRNELLTYQQKAPINVLNEIINQWEDWINIQNLEKTYPSPTYTPEERAAIIEYHKIWNEIAGKIPEEVETIHQFLETSLWQILSKGAQASLEVFQVRGRLSED